MKVDALHTLVVSEWQASWWISSGRTQSDRKAGEYWKKKVLVNTVCLGSKGKALKIGCELCNEVATSGEASRNHDGGQT